MAFAFNTHENRYKSNIFSMLECFRTVLHLAAIFLSVYTGVPSILLVLEQFLAILEHCLHIGIVNARAYIVEYIA